MKESQDMEKSHKKTWVDYVYIDHMNIWLVYAFLCWMIGVVDNPKASMFFAVSSSILGLFTCAIGLYKFYKERGNKNE